MQLTSGVELRSMGSTAAHCNMLPNAATQCNKLHHSLTHQGMELRSMSSTAIDCNKLQQAATSCNKLQYSATYQWGGIEVDNLNSKRNDTSRRTYT